MTDLSDERVRDGGGLLTLRLYQSKKPLISACNGAAVGVGVTMQLPMDIRLASENARYGFVFARRGIVPEAASSWFLPRIVGMGHAMDIILSGERVDADHALRIGLVNRVYPADQLLARTLDYAQMLASRSPLSHRFAKEVMRRSVGMPLDEALRLESRSFYDVGLTEDLAEGTTSFREKRAASFKGR